MKNLLINSEARFVQSEDGQVWTETAFPYSYWEKYLTEFLSVRVLARVRLVKDRGKFKQLVGGPGVTVVALPYYVGSWGFVAQARAIRSIIDHELTRPFLAIILITPSPLSLIFERAIRARFQAYGVEVLGDPAEVFSEHGVRHPLRIILRWWLSRRQKSLLRNAKAALYVTQKSLQTRYPPGANTFSVGVSNINLEPIHLVKKTVPLNRPYKNAVKIVGVGSLEQMYKGVDILLASMRILKDQNYDVRLTWIGGGRCLNELLQLRDRLDLQESVTFEGSVESGEPVRDFLDAADLFVLPSRTEGLPRAVVEAMARGLPCVGANVGGIPELLQQSELFPKEDSAAAARLIATLILDPARRKSIAIANLEKSRDFVNEKLEERKREFWQSVSR